MKKKYFVIFILLFCASMIFVYWINNTKIYSIPTSFMYPSLSAQTSKRGWIIKNEDQAYNLPRKSIIVYKKNENSEFTNSIGRIIGLPGEIVEIIDSQTYINGEFLSEPYVTWSGKNKNLDKIQVNNDEVLVMYDNRSTFPVHTSLVPLKSIEAHFGTIVVESEN